MDVDVDVESAERVVPKALVVDTVVLEGRVEVADMYGGT